MQRGRKRAETAGVVAPLAVAGAIVWLQVWHGPTLLTLSADHGVDTGDLIALPFLLLAIAVARGRPVRFRPPAWSLAASSLALGVLLLLSWLLAGEGGALVPAGGATLDGRIAQAMAPNAVEVDRWTAIALTYDGAVQRLYVDGREVARRPARGRIQTPGTPLWIGGNEPYGEHFDGRIDEVRAFDRALSPAEIRRDMAVPVRPERGLVAGYGFDAGRGGTVADASGRGNTGVIEGASWARGRYGSALSFDGSGSRVRVAPSPSLDVGRALTLSAWIRPAGRQGGWRAVAQREVDAYFLSAGSGRVDRDGVLGAVRILLIVAAVGWFAFLVAAGRAPRGRLRRRTWWLPLPLFALGSAVDAACFPTITMFGPLLVALWLAATARGRIERASLWVAAGVIGGLTLASLAGLGDVTGTLTRFDGATARSVALGALFVLGGLAARPGAQAPSSAAARI